MLDNLVGYPFWHLLVLSDVRISSVIRDERQAFMRSFFAHDLTLELWDRRSFFAKAKVTRHV